jgi:fermentation-respiration switch protein FrsA (DUF1100 family)
MTKPHPPGPTLDPRAAAAPDRRDLLKMTAAGVATLSLAAILDPSTAKAKDMPDDAKNFYESDQVTVQKVTFLNQYKMKVAGNLFLPKTLDRDAAHPAIVVGHPMGAVKEQSANLYAPRWLNGASWPCPWTCRSGALARVNRATRSRQTLRRGFSAAVDFLGSQGFVDRKRIGAIGICGSGSFVISAAKIDPRMKAIATVSMYDMGRSTAMASALATVEQRKQAIAAAAEQRWPSSPAASRNTPAGRSIS